jgi:hypothetical protein
MSVPNPGLRWLRVASSAVNALLRSVILIAVRGRRKRLLVLVLCLVAVSFVAALLDLALDALGDLKVLPWRLDVVREHPGLSALLFLTVLAALSALIVWIEHAGDVASDSSTGSESETDRVPRRGLLETNAVEARAEMTKFPIHESPRVGVEVKLYAVPLPGSEVIIPDHQVSMELQLGAVHEAAARVRAPQSLPGETQTYAIRQDSQQIVIERPGYFTVTGGLSAPAELEHAPPDSIDVLFSFRPAGCSQPTTYELTLLRTQPAEGLVPGPQFRAQWEWRADAPR